MGAVLRTYRLDGLAGLINETFLDCRRGKLPKRYRAWSFQPGDIVRDQLFEDDRGRPSRDFPVGLVLWCHDSNSPDDVGVLWSGEPNA